MNDARGGGADPRPDPRMQNVAPSRLVEMHTDQQELRELTLRRIEMGNSDNPAQELAAVQELITFCLRKLQHFVGPGEKQIDAKVLDRWTRRQLIAGNVRVWEDWSGDFQGEFYRVQSACQSSTEDSDCPVFIPCDKTVKASDRAAAVKTEEDRVTRWCTSVLSQLLSKLERELERVGWINEEFGPVDMKGRAHDERQRRVAGGRPSSAAPSSQSGRVE